MRGGKKSVVLPERGETGYKAMIVEVDRDSLRAAAEVHSVSWKDSHRAFCSEAFVEAHTPERQEAYLLGKMRGGSRLFLLVDGSPAGVVSVAGDLIEDLYVLPECRGRGLGTRLLRYAMDRCAGIPSLWILENNRDAERLYLRMGFRRTGRTKAVTDGLNEIELALTDGPPVSRGP